MNKWKDIFKTFGLSHSATPEHSVFEKYIERANVMSVAWGLETLLALPSIKDPEKGTKMRAKLRMLFMSNVKGKEEQMQELVGKETLEKIGQILSIKDVKQLAEEETKQKGAKRMRRGTKSS